MCSFCSQEGATKVQNVISHMKELEIIRWKKYQNFVRIPECVPGSQGVDTYIQRMGRLYHRGPPGWGAGLCRILHHPTAPGLRQVTGKYPGGRHSKCRCNQILPLVSLMNVDEIGEFQMAIYRGRTVKSDQNMLKLEIDLEFHKKRKHDEMDVFNVRNKLNQERFCEFTSKDTRFSDCFSSKNEIIDIQFNRWRRLFNRAIHACFNKIKVKEKKSQGSISTRQTH